ncbi:MAG TPA: VIT and VWA domain-containing protein [Pyrinomonadaceae bacterium]|nr:VIT and VWA domain-containing protein [Pyrinomonadaceae bacterium]
MTIPSVLIRDQGVVFKFVGVYGEIMRVLKLRILLVCFSVFLFSALNVAAQGVIVPGPCRRCPDGPRPTPLPRSLPIKSIKIDTKISSQVATTHLEQIFRNDTDAVLEGTYFFPIPEQASITEFAIWDGDRRLVGEVRSREEARRIYDEIVRRQRDPGLLEYAGKNLFQASIFPIPARSDKKLELTYTQVLQAESGTVAYRYPLGTGRQMAEIGSVSGRIELDSKEPLRNVYSPTHAVDVKRNGDRRSVVSFESGAGKEQQDFQLFYTRSDEDFGVTVLTHRDAGKDGYFLLMVSPKEDWSEQEYAAKDIVFVLDTSGSMAEAGKMEKARAALLYGIRILRPQDRFNVVSFAGEERLMETRMIAADDQGRRRGETFVQSLRPTGGTAINQAVLVAMRQFETSNRPKILIFMTDGLPTVGESNPAKIIENARTARTPGVRLFTFGVGYDVNTALLDKLASENGGVADYVEPKEDIEVKVSNFFAKINHPVLTDLQLDLAGVETDLTYPRALPDLFKGSQLTLIGRYRNQIDMDHVRLKLTGNSRGSNRTFVFDNLRFPLRENNDFLPRLWATRRVGWLMEQIRSNGEQQELRDEVVDLGTRYGIVTPYTSYLALEPGAGPQNVTRQNNNFGFMGGARRANAPPPPAPADAAAVTGRAAVTESKRARSQQEASKLDGLDSTSSAVKIAGGKTFYLRDGVWTDSEFKAGSKLPETVIKFGSDEYFNLLQQKPRLGDFLSLGERVIVVFEGRVYRVDAATP